MAGNDTYKCGRTPPVLVQIPSQVPPELQMENSAMHYTKLSEKKIAKKLNISKYCSHAATVSYPAVPAPFLAAIYIVLRLVFDCFFL